MGKLLCRDGMLRLAANVRERPEQWLSRLIFLLGPWVSFWMVEILNGNDVFSDLYSWQVLMNLIWYYLLFLLCRLILGRRRRAAATAAGLSFFVGIVNHYVLRFRGRILFPADLTAWETAANVADAFDFSLDAAIRQGAVLLVAYLFLVWMCVPQRKRDKLPRWLAGLLVLVEVGYCFVFFKTEALPALGIYTQQWVTQANGFLLNFTVALRYSSLDKPEDYSRGQVLELMESYPTEAGDPAARPTNIIVVMNESFADLTIFEGLEVSEDPTPFLHSMKENTVRGWMYSPVTGGGTASVEFEYLTGFSTIFQPPHTVAYQLYAEEGMPSLAALAGSVGYDSTAFHPYKSSGWNRPIVYEDMRFDHQLYEEDVTAPYLIRRYVSDQSDYETLYSITDRAEGDPAFIFNVTMQNHGGYEGEYDNFEQEVWLTGQYEGKYPKTDQYLSLMKRSDQAFQYLVEYFSRTDQPTMIVMFGDHQPSVEDEFYDDIAGMPSSEVPAQEHLMWYETPFIIWTNYSMPSGNMGRLGAVYLSSEVLWRANLEMTPYNRFLLAMREELPVVHPLGCYDREGTYYYWAKAESERCPYQDTVLDYEALVYNHSLDRKKFKELFVIDSENSISQ